MANPTQGPQPGAPPQTQVGQNPTNQIVVDTLLKILEDLQRRLTANPQPSPISERDFALGAAAFEIIRSGLSLEESPLEISDISPKAGPAAGGSPVTITGKNFVPPATVAFGGHLSNDVTVVSASEIRAVAPPAATGVVNVVVTTLGGAVERRNGFTNQ